MRTLDWAEDIWMRTRVARWIALGGVMFVLALIAFWVVLQFWQPKPAGRLVIGTGGSESAYHEYAVILQKALAKRGIEVELRPALEGTDSLKALFSDDSGVDAGFVKGGFASTLQGRLATTKAREWHDTNLPKVRSVGRLFYEPLWVFVRADHNITSLRDLKARKIYVGTKSSGTRRIATQILKANGVEGPAKDQPQQPHHAILIDENLPADGGQLINGDAEAAFLILPPESPRIQELLHNPKLHLLDFGAEADAYTTRYPSLTKVVLHQGSVDFDPKVPPRDVTLLTTSTALVIRDDLHPALASMLSNAVVRNPKSGFDKDGEPILFHTPGQFPQGSDPEYAFSAEARQVYKTGDLPYLLAKAAPVVQALRLPFGIAAFADAHGAQTILLLIPALTILYPIIKIIPMLYTWTVRQRLLYWYRQLKGLEAKLDKPHTIEEVARQLDEVERIDGVVRRIRVPLHFTDQIYDLRGHIEFVRRRLESLASTLRAAATVPAAAE